MKPPLHLPGQGSQAVGMGAICRGFGDAREVFQEIDDAPRPKLSKLNARWARGSADLTENAAGADGRQPGGDAHPEKEFGVSVDKAAFVAGHSLGEYSAWPLSGPSAWRTPPAC